MSTATIFTIGHSSHEVVSFLTQLSNKQIQVVVDVRSAPYFRYVPQFNRKEIEMAQTLEPKII